MLLSMTGFGEARHGDDQLSVVVEVRSVNNRHLKLITKISDPFAALEPEFERQIREVARRGTIHLTVRADRPKQAEDYRINAVALKSYYEQIVKTLGDVRAEALSGLLNLPGVVEGRRDQPDDDPRDEWPRLAATLGQALAKFQESRAEEGAAMAAELKALGHRLAEGLEQVERRGPDVVSAYQTRLEERIAALVQGRVVIEPKDLIREVAILSERADVSEEIIRLKAHLAQYQAVIDEPESAGRKLEFIVQEMGRETNTIGSKANDIEISRSVVEMKSALEKIRELIQNVE